MTKAEKRDVLRAALLTDVGRVALREILAYCKTDVCVFNAESERQTTFNLGRQDVGRWLKDITKEGS